MRTSQSYTIIISLYFVFGALAIAACTAKNSRLEAQNISSSNVNVRRCEIWEQAQVTGQGLGWDLVYESTLKRNGFGSDSPMWKWIHEDGSRPPVNQMVAGWQGDSITSSVLIEIAGPEGSPGGFWYIRTTNRLYKWDFNKGKFDPQKEELTTLQEYDKAFEEMKCWQQGEAVRTDSLFEGYYGFSSLYKEGKSRQMLLTFRDFFLVDPRDSGKNLEDPNNWGRIWKTLAPVLSSKH
jgi:hypothetical protein